MTAKNEFKPRLISEQKACERACFSRWTINELVRRGDFPKPVKISDKRKAYVADEVDAWVEARIAAR
ncbi:AlpA family phage regulatory protein [Fulvimarina manganoxydans]|uniref:helix-turn-helix transcriptional regulator n=1 Tax=Fulvimarina manganoxydans TaxID=937218 RepID=UPI000A009FD8